jgi:nucleoside phosphorylase
MEGSGIEDGTWNAGQHYILIRGISDYCDGSKNDMWQGYAAVVAASYARALIESLPTKAGLPQEH